MTFLTHPTHSTLQRFVSGDLGDVERDAARAHLDGCGGCRRRASEISQIFAALATPPSLPEPPIDFLAAVMARIEREVRVPSLISSTVAWQSIVAAFAFAILGALLFDRGGGAATVRLWSVEAAHSLALFVRHAGLISTVGRAAAPPAFAAAFASLVVLVPILWKAIQSVQRPVRVRASA